MPSRGENFACVETKFVPSGQRSDLSALPGCDSLLCFQYVKSFGEVPAIGMSLARCLLALWMYKDIIEQIVDLVGTSASADSR